MQRKLLTGVLGAMVAAVALVPTATAGSAVKSKVTISAQEGSFSGFVLSEDDDCHNGRKVTLYRRKAGVRKPNYKKDRKIGSDIATPNQDGSQWKIDIEQRGKYYAHVKKTRGCRAAYSKVKRGTPAPPPEEEVEG